MSTEKASKPESDFRKAQDLEMIVRFDRDDSLEGKMRMEQAKAIICQLILLGKKRGRPSKKEENSNAAA